MVNGALYSPKYNYIAYYSAKAGCSSLKHLFIDLHKGELPLDAQSQIITHNAKMLFAIHENVDVTKTKRFVLVRNPYLRAVSMYINKYIGENSHIKKSMREKDVTNKFGESFLSFLKFLRSLKKKNLLNKIDGHMYEQSYEYNPNDKIQIIKLENFEEEIKKFYRKKFKEDTNLLNKVEDLFSENTKSYNANKTKIQNNSEEKDVADVEFTEKMDVVIPNYNGFYNKETKELVDSIFHDDFVNFDYEKTIDF
jgi:hypothetical protein